MSVFRPNVELLPTLHAGTVEVAVSLSKDPHLLAELRRRGVGLGTEATAPVYLAPDVYEAEEVDPG